MAGDALVFAQANTVVLVHVCIHACIHVCMYMYDYACQPVWNVG